MARAALFCLLLTACGSAASPGPATPGTPQPLPTPADIHGPLAGDVPGGSGSLVVHVRAERDSGGVPRVWGVYVTHGDVACGDVLEEHAGLRAHVGSDNTAPVLSLTTSFHTDPEHSPTGKGWIALAPGELTSGGQVHGKLFVQTTDGASRVAGELTAKVCLDPPRFSASADVTITIDGVTTHATFAHASAMFGQTTIELASALGSDGEERGSDAVAVQILTVPATPDGALFAGAPFAPVPIMVFAPGVDRGTSVRGTVTIAPFVLGEYARLRGTISVPREKVRYGKQVISVEGTFEAQLGDGPRGIYAWLAAQHLPDGLPMVRIGKASAAVRSARVTTTSEGRTREDLVELLDTDDPCAANAHVLAQFEQFGSPPALAPPDYGPIKAAVGGELGSINGWIALATAPTVHGWVFAVDPPFDERVKPDRVELAGHFDAKACPAPPPAKR